MGTNTMPVCSLTGSSMWRGCARKLTSSGLQDLRWGSVRSACGHAGRQPHLKDRLHMRLTSEWPWGAQAHCSSDSNRLTVAGVTGLLSCTDVTPLQACRLSRT